MVAESNTQRIRHDTEVAAIKAKTDNLPADPATETTLTTLDGLIDAIKALTDKLDTALEDDGASGYQFTTLALVNGPSGGGGGDATLANQAAIVALETHGDSTWSTATGFAEPGDAMTLTSGERSAVAGAVDVALINTGDGADLIGALADAIAADWVAGDASPLAIASAVRTELATELAHLDADVSSRLAPSGYTAAPSAATIASQVDTTLTAAHGSGLWAAADVSGLAAATRDLILGGDQSVILMDSGMPAVHLNSTTIDAMAATIAASLGSIQLSIQSQLTVTSGQDLSVIQGDDYTRVGTRIELDTSGMEDPDIDLSAFKFVVSAQNGSTKIVVRMDILGDPGEH